MSLKSGQQCSPNSLAELSRLSDLEMHFVPAALGEGWSEAGSRKLGLFILIPVADFFFSFVPWPEIEFSECWCI